MQIICNDKYSKICLWIMRPCESKHSKRVYHLHVYQSGYVFDTEVVLCKIYTDLQGLVSIGFCKSFIKLSPLYVPTFPQEMKFRRVKVLNKSATMII